MDHAAREVLLPEERIPFDYLILATGAQHSYFGRDEWAAYAPGLKSIEDATAMRSRMLLAFEQAESERDPAKREAWLTFVVVGGGPTGVELAGALAELARTGLEKEYRAIDPATARVILVQSAPRVLPAFSSALSAHAERSLRDLGVEVRTDAKVTHIDHDGVEIDGLRIAARTTFWAAGVCGVTGREVARTGRRQIRSRRRRWQSGGSRLPRRVRDRRHGRLERVGGRRRPRPGPRRKAAGALRRRA